MYSITSPATLLEYKKVPLASEEEAKAVVLRSSTAQKEWKTVPLSDRQAIVSKFIDFLLEEKEEIATELTNCIGRPRKYNFNEMRGFTERNLTCDFSRVIITFIKR
jgi:acyl-CoA reductase-like NAD-dependent aldehyde dehydrogenase